MTPTVRFENVSKVYLLGERKSLREAASEALAHLFQGGDSNGAQTVNALREVSIEIEPGEALGIIGPNGVGKSTTLKLIAGITQATSGRVSVSGRVAALLELGAGFHPDLTGRENIYLNSAIMGMSRKEIDQRFDEIVAFSELQRFLDTPVKRYSSGMYCRLGFSVAAHVNPDILLVDEVLAVGDMAFQAKCYQRIRELKMSGVTIVFVTHALTVLRRLCDRAILLHGGQIANEGDTAEVVATYLDNPKYASNLANDYDRMPVASPHEAANNSSLYIKDVTFLDSDRHEIATSRTGDTLTVRVSYVAREPIPEPSLTIKVLGLEGTQYGGYNSGWDGIVPAAIEGSGHVEVTFDPVCMLPGVYLISVMLADREGLAPYHSHEQRYRLQILSGGVSAHPMVYMPHTWHWISNDGRVTSSRAHQGGKESE